MQPPEIARRLTDLMEEERPGVFRFCLRCCARPDVAEDLVQETFVEAWRNRHKLGGPTLSSGWLYRIARNVCLRWRRAQGYESGRLGVGEESATPFPETLERQEIGHLLDRAMEALPARARRLLVGRYIEELPIDELARREKTSEGTLAVQLYRGRLALQKVLTTRFPQEALAFGLVFPEGGMRTPTPIWCPDCGGARLVFAPRPDAPASQFRLVCPVCSTLPRSIYLFADLSTPEMQRIVEGVRGYRPILKRLDAAGTRWLNDGLKVRSARCDHCGQTASLRRVPAGSGDGPLATSFRVVVSCPCGRTNFMTRLGRIHHGLPEVQRFWTRASRMRRLPDRRLEVGGTAAILTRFESLTGASSLDVLVREDDFTLLKVEKDFSKSV